MPRNWIAAALVVLLGSAAPASDEVAPLWPLDLETRYLTGNFMEPRAGRFHTGLDIKTNSRTGYAVLAVRDGWVSRIKFAPGGYGKAVYLATGDGTTYVYGHLERLQDRLQMLAVTAQARRGAYGVDLNFERDELPVARGDILALSGQTATSGPHLHFEVRGPDGSPLDPLAHGFQPVDTIAPEILAVRAVDLGEHTAPPSLLAGDGETPLAGDLPVLHLPHGRFIFTVRVVERSDRLRYRLGPWRVRFWQDGVLAVGAANEEVRWSAVRQQRLEFVATDLGAEHLLARDERNTLIGREGDLMVADATLSEGRHDLRLVAEDRAGNRSEVRWIVVVGVEDQAPGWRASETIWPEPWLVGVAGPIPREGEVAGSPRISWRRGRAERPATGRWLQLAGLEPVGLPIQFRSTRAAMLAARTVAWPKLSPEATWALTDPAVAVYGLDDGEWEYESALDGGSFDLDRPGIYGLVRDTARPLIATATVARELVRRPPTMQHGISLPRWPLVKIPVGDHGSGVDWESLDVRLDGAPLVVEPDPPRDRIVVELPDATGPGPHRLRVSVADRAGHDVAVEVDLMLREGGAGNDE